MKGTEKIITRRHEGLKREVVGLLARLRRAPVNG